MSYEDLLRRTKQMRISMSIVANEVGITLEGLKRGIDNQSLSIKYIPQLCKSLCITPDELLGFTIDPRKTFNVDHTEKDIVKIDAKAFELIKKQLEEKDKQIDKLLDKISNERVIIAESHSSQIEHRPHVLDTKIS